MFNTWLGHGVDVLKLRAVQRVVAQERLFENTAITGKFLQDGLFVLQGRYPSLISDVRGAGTFCAFDVSDAASRDKMVGELRQRGTRATRRYP